MLYMKYGKNQLHGFRGDVDRGRRMYAWLYYKLTYEPLAQMS